MLQYPLFKYNTVLEALNEDELKARRRKVLLSTLRRSNEEIASLRASLRARVFILLALLLVAYVSRGYTSLLAPSQKNKSFWPIQCCI